MPFDWHAPLGYSIALLEQAIVAYCACCMTSPVTCFIAGSCWLFVAFVEDITSDLCALNAEIKSTNANQMDVKKRFCEIINLYSDVKQLSGNAIKLQGHMHA